MILYVQMIWYHMFKWYHIQMIGSNDIYYSLNVMFRGLQPFIAAEGNRIQTTKTERL